MYIGAQIIEEDEDQDEQPADPQSDDTESFNIVMVRLSLVTKRPPPYALSGRFYISTRFAVSHSCGCRYLPESARLSKRDPRSRERS